MLKIVILSALLFWPTEPQASTFSYKPVSPGIFRGVRPRNEEKLRWLADQGIRNIINLQGTGTPFQPGEKPGQIAESERIARSLGLGYFKTPFSSGEDNPLSPEERVNVLATVSLLRDTSLHPIYVHCFFGADRTGVAVAAFRILAQGCSFEKARDEMYLEGGAWTERVTRGQLPFLQELTTRERPPASECPLP